MSKANTDKDKSILLEILTEVIGSSSLCYMEILPSITPVDHPQAVQGAAEAARKAGTAYFLTINLKDAILWHTFKKGKSAAREDRLKTYPTLHQIAPAGVIDETSKITLRKRAQEILEDLNTLQCDGRLRTIEADATFFVNRLARAAETMRGPLKQSLATTVSRDPKFKKALEEWAVKQGIANFGEESFFESLSRQLVYRTLGKIIFYQSLRRHIRTLPDMDFSGVDDAMIVSRLRHYFDLARAIDYQAIFEEELTERIPYPQAAIDELRSLFSDLNYYNFYTVPQDVIGQVFERLIPPEERHALGQYFTREDLVDIITAFCARSPDAKVLDPTCGTGTFLLRAYDRKKTLGEHNHQRLLESLWGVDIARFPAELATINLYRQNLTDYANFPRILAQDFFEVKPNQTFRFPPPKPVEQASSLFIEEPLPLFDATVGNFPYIRQELIEKQVKGYKNFLEQVLADGWRGDYRELFDSKGNLKLSGQADIYAYLFFQTARFLKPIGRMGIVTSNAWLDVAYGYELQKFFLKKFKIIAILESRCEPWFEDVSVNTIVTILERCDDSRAGVSPAKDHIVKFMKIKKPLKELIPWDMKSDAVNRWRGLDNLVAKIEGAGREHIQLKGTEVINTLRGLKTYEEADFRIRCIRQGELLDEVEQAGKTVKWGKYLRAPEVYFEILDKCKDKLVPLKEVAEIRRGYTTGINEFFYLTEERIREFRIEEEFLKPVLKSPKEFEGILIDPAKLTTKVFLCQKSKEELRREGKTGALKYIEWGEKQKTGDGVTWSDVPSVRYRKFWWAIEEKNRADFFTMGFVDKRFCVPVNDPPVFASDVFFEWFIKDERKKSSILAFLNSSLMYLFIEMTGRTNLGDGVLKVIGPDLDDLFVAELMAGQAKKNISAFDALRGRPIKPIFEEVKMADRQKLDSLVLECLGLDPKKYLKPLYDGLCELVSERIELAKMRKKVKKTRPERDIEKVKREVIQEFLPDGPKRFPEDFLDPSGKEDKMKEVSLPDEPLRLGNYFFGEQEVITDSGFTYKAKSPVEAKYLIYSQRPGVKKVLVPTETMPLFKTVKNFETYLRNLLDEMAKALLNRTIDQQMAERLLYQILEENRLPELK